MKKTWLALALGASVLATSVAAPAQADTLRVGTHPTFAPFEFTDNDGNIIGFDLDIIKAIAKVNGDEVVVESMPFDGLIPSILTGNLDVIISGMTITDARKKRVEFSEGYYDSNLSIIIKKDMAETYKTADDLKGKTICVQIGTTGALYLQKTLKDPDLKQFNTPPETYLELQNGGCDVVVNDRPVNDFFLAQNPKNKDIVASHDITAAQNEYYGIAVRKGNTELLDKLNAGLKTLRDNGTYDQIYQKWFKLAPKD